MQVKDADLNYYGYEKVTALSSAKSLTVPDGAHYALLKTESQSVRWKGDATNPDATTGMLIDVGDEFWYTAELRDLRFIETAASATLHVAYFG